jgi:hypothetical protein
VKPKTLAFLLLIGAGAVWGSVFGFCYWALSKFAKPVEFTPSPTWVQAPGGQMVPVTDDYLADHGWPYPIHKHLWWETSDGYTNCECGLPSPRCAP